jgi:RNA polymerase sigma-70 factor, ECF subfamily
VVALPSPISTYGPAEAEPSCAPGCHGDGASDDRARLARLYAAVAPRIHRFLSDLLFDSVLAKDATQETFARALLRPEVLRDEDRAIPWLFGVARNISLELRKARARHGRVMEPDPDGRKTGVGSECPEAHFVGQEAARRLEKALRALSEDRRALLLLRLDHGLSYDAIAESMGFSLAKVKVEIFRARESLRASLEENQ